MLATRLLRQSTSQLLVRTAHPPPLAHSVPLRRAFHASVPRNDAVLDAFLYLPHEMMSLIHNQLPWYATIPLSAFLVRGLLVTTAGSWARSLTARYIGLHPLRQAIAHQKRHQVTQRGGYNNPKAAIAAVSREVKIATAALDERWKCTLWGQINWTLAQIPLFITMAEVVRQMCNAQDGLLSMSLTGLGLKTAASSSHGVSLGPPNEWFQPSLAEEGMLWFPDLLVADPTGALPFVVSAMMFTNVYFTKNGPANPDNAPRASKAIRRLLLGVSLLIGPICQHLPAALMLYWASSTGSVMLWNRWLDWRHPAPKDFLACKRPLQILPAPKSRRV